MDPVPYEIREEDIDEVLDAYEPVGGGLFPESERRRIREYVLRHVDDISEIVRVAPETDEIEATAGRDLPGRAGSIADRPGDRSPARHELALAAIEDLLIRDGFIDLEPGESRTFPAVPIRDTERDDA